MQTASTAPNCRTGTTLLVSRAAVAEGAGQGAPEDRRRDAPRVVPGRRPAVGVGPQVVAEVQGQVAGGRHRQDDDLGDQRPARERELQARAARATVSAPSQTVQPATSGTSAHQRLRVAVNVTRPIRAMPTTASRRPSVSIAVKPSASKHGRPDDRRPAQAVPAAKASAAVRRPATVAFDVVLPVGLQPDDDRRGRARRSISGPLEERVGRQPGLQGGQLSSSAAAFGRGDRAAGSKRRALSGPTRPGPAAVAARPGRCCPRRRSAAIASEGDQAVVHLPELGHRVERLDPDDALDRAGPSGLRQLGHAVDAGGGQERRDPRRRRRRAGRCRTRPLARL